MGSAGTSTAHHGRVECGGCRRRRHIAHRGSTAHLRAPPLRPPAIRTSAVVLPDCPARGPADGAGAPADGRQPATASRAGDRWIRTARRRHRGSPTGDSPASGGLGPTVETHVVCQQRVRRSGSTCQAPCEGGASQPLDLAPSAGSGGTLTLPGAEQDMGLVPRRLARAADMPPRGSGRGAGGRHDG